MKSLKSLALLTTVLVLISGCSPAASTPTNAPTMPPPKTTLPITTEVLPTPVPQDTPTPVVESPTPEPESGDVLMRIRLATTSDWTVVTLLAGTTWREHNLISTSAGATNTLADFSKLILEQQLERAEAGESVEMVSETLFSPWESGRDVVLKIERGNLGSTDLEISRQVDGEWVAIKKVSWGKITEALNEYRIEIPADQLFGDSALTALSSLVSADAEPVSPLAGLPEGTDGYPWWNDATFYEIFVRSFYDSNGDGIGDLAGITQKLDYLNDGDPETSTDLGVTGIWLMPIFPSPTYHGYNVTDHKAVNPQYGTMEDFQNLLEAAHQRGIHVILDFIVGQTSNEHPWFISSRNPASPYRDWYIWLDYDPGYMGSWGQQVWFPYNGYYYYGTFSAYSPDLNHTNPLVTEQIEDAVRFWLEEVGVDGFRLDSAKHIIEEGTKQSNTTSTHDWWKDFRTFYKGVNPEAVTVAEIWEHTSVNAEYLQGDEFDLSFEFSLSYQILKAINQEDAGIINSQVQLSYNSIPPLQFSTFLANHDQDRLMDQLGYSPEKVRVAAAILLTAPGVPFLYYGEEIGMQGIGHEDARRPMQWSAEPSAGFTTGSPWSEPGPEWEANNVSSMAGDSNSLLSFYRNLILARNQHAALRVGDLDVVNTNNGSIYSILRVSSDESLLVLINLGGESVTDYKLSLESSSLAEGSYIPAPILGEGGFAPLMVLAGGGFSEYVPAFDVPPYGTFILQLQKSTRE